MNNYPDLKMQFALQMIDSVNTLHRQKILHGDIHLDNFMICEDKLGKEVIKLSNFDKSCPVEESIYENN